MFGFGSAVAVGTVGVAGKLAYDKLNGMESADISKIGARVAEMVTDFGERASQNEFVKNVRGMLEGSAIGGRVVDAFSKMPGNIAGGANKFFEAMAAAKAQAEAGNGSFAKNLVSDVGHSIGTGLQGAISSGAAMIAEKFNLDAPSVTMAGAYDVYDAPAASFAELGETYDGPVPASDDFGMEL